MTGDGKPTGATTAMVSTRPEVFVAIVVEHQHAVHALLAQMLFHGSLADVDDLAQETFLRVHRAIDQFEDRGPGSLRAWILRIAARVAIDHLRRRPAVDVPFDEGLHQRRGAGADALIRYRRVGARVEAALSELSVEQRSVLVLRQLHGLDYQEIADLLQVDLGTVKSRLHRARARLRAALVQERSG